MVVLTSLSSFGQVGWDTVNAGSDSGALFFSSSPYSSPTIFIPKGGAYRAGWGIPVNQLAKIHACWAIQLPWEIGTDSATCISGYASDNVCYTSTTSGSISTTGSCNATVGPDNIPQCQNNPGLSSVLPCEQKK